MKWKFNFSLEHNTMRMRMMHSEVGAASQSFDIILSRSQSLQIIENEKLIITIHYFDYSLSRSVQLYWEGVEWSAQWADYVLRCISRFLLPSHSIHHNHLQSFWRIIRFTHCSVGTAIGSQYISLLSQAEAIAWKLYSLEAIGLHRWQSRVV